MKKHTESGRTEIEKRARDMFERSVADLDGATRSKLTRARHRALREMDRPAAARQWLAVRPQLVAGAAAVVAVGIAWVLLPDRAALVPTAQLAEVDDFELLLGEDELELIEDLDFYAWLEGEPEFNPDGEDGAG